ncbi:hypothetical protein SAMN02745119_00216 [Trichlorobacter thiogenes]|uniref:Uncharacterized protein n=1 Tax=Trichlorobacter thiogenes TaxID=115783 RepID=A0A1T4JZQ5_9BACT|nr:hypothetical protein [Trichlorobacter thiogenes]SJZ35706.1 hypothetical protein SAMN02745119_00216 [Trichlorobacter thiogenes]
MTTTEAKQKSCPLQRSSLCEASKCMAWQSTSKEEGFCQMISRSRTVFVSPQSAALQVSLEDVVRLKTDKAFDVCLVQGFNEYLDVQIRN